MVVVMVCMLVAVMCCSTDMPRGLEGRAHLSLPFLGNLVSLHLGPCRKIFLVCCLTVFEPCLV